MGFTMPRVHYDVANEQILLANIIRDSEKGKVLAKVIGVDEFIGRKHRVIFEAVRKCVDKNRSIDENNILLFAEEEFGGLEYLRRLGQFELSTDIDEMVLTLKRDACRLRVSKSIPDLGTILIDRGVEFDACVDTVRGLFDELKKYQINGNGTEEKVKQWLREYEDRCRAGEGVFRTTGYSSLDGYMTEGLAPKNLTIIAGRTRAGKTMFLVDMIRRLIEVGVSVLVVPFEKGSSYFLTMLICSIARVEIMKLMKYPDKLTEREKQKIDRATKKINKLVEEKKLVVIEREQLLGDNPLDNLESLVSGSGVEVIAYDLLERLFPELRPQYISSALTRVQGFGPQYGIHQIIVQQLGRRAEDRMRTKEVKKKPSLTDVKNSGAYEEVADQVLLIHREKVYKPYMRTDVIEIEVAKQKLGGDGFVMEGDFLPAISRIENDRIIEESEIDAGNNFIQPREI